MAQARDLTLHAADVGDQSARGEAGTNRLRQRDDSLNRGGQHHEAGATHGVFRRVADLVAPGLGPKLQAILGLARPQHDATGESTMPRGLRHRAAEQSWRQDGKLLKHSPTKSRAPAVVEPG